MPGWTTRDTPDQAGRLAVITGSTGGIGFETALALAAKGAEVIIAARNPDKGEAALREIRKRAKAADVRFEPLDLASQASVTAFAALLLAVGRPLDILVNNAGVMALARREVTEDGFEMQLATNYLGHFALTGRLLPLLAKARVVQVSSVAHRSGQIHLEDLQFARGYKPWPVYAQSKLAMLMFALELDRRSKAGGWGLTSLAAHPGYARTDLIANGPARGSGLTSVAIGALRLFEPLVSHSQEAGALPLLQAACDMTVPGGSYIGPQRMGEYKGPPGPARIEPKAADVGVASALWAASEALTGVRFGSQT